ncbi:MAG: hypothetical protein ACE5I9_12675 [Candidatus Methylomirabilales bacterium]
MQVRYEAAFLDAVLSTLIQEREATDDLRFTQEYHALTDPAYRLAPFAREEAFQHIHRRLFRRWNIAAPFEAVLTEFPELLEQVQTLWVVRAATSRDEGADLQFPGQTAAILRLLPRRLLDPRGLQRLLRHELTHLADMLDPTFAYHYTEQITGILPAEEPLVRDRYRLLWDVTIDSRLLRAGRQTVAGREQRRSEFEVQYRGVPAPLMERAFGRLWEMPRPSHPELLEMATHPGRALFEGGQATIRFLPGSRCPLCRFPSRSLRQGTGGIPVSLAEEIRRDFPGWRPDLGACERCLEGYTVSQETS